MEKTLPLTDRKYGIVVFKEYGTYTATIILMDKDSNIYKFPLNEHYIYPKEARESATKLLSEILELTDEKNIF
ncbi:hypothetical protein [Ignavibacterium sp.]|uniref:hypothetical protein n=1 Tax=Ignavibacterium sp. TaxID=2651167 RepID=UPI00307D5750